MRAAPALLLAALATAAGAQPAPTDSLGADSLAAGRQVEVAFPTEGGVFYYRAGPARRRVAYARQAPPAAGEPDRSVAITGQSPRTTDAPPSGRDPLAAPLRPGLPPAAPGVAAPAPVAPGGVTQADLDRLEARLMAEIDRRLAGLYRPAEIRPDPPAEPARPPAAPPREPVPDAPPAPTPPVVRDDGVTADEIERDILDTGLFRTTAVYFEFAQADLLPASERTLATLADVLRRNPDVRLEVGGHTDAVGSDETNDRLSVRRAASVRSFLVAAGVDPARLTSAGYGERRPIASNGDEAGRALNRRVEFAVIGGAQLP